MYLQEGWHRGLGLFSQIIPSVREACPIFALETDFFPCITNVNSLVIAGSHFGYT